MGKIEEVSFQPQTGWSVIEEVSKTEQTKSGLILTNGNKSNFEEYRVIITNHDPESQLVPLTRNNHIYISKNDILKIRVDGEEFLMCENKNVVLIKEIVQ